MMMRRWEVSCVIFSLLSLRADAPGIYVSGSPRRRWRFVAASLLGAPLIGRLPRSALSPHLRWRGGAIRYSGRLFAPYRFARRPRRPKM